MSEAAADAVPERPALGVQIASYGTGFFSFGLTTMGTLAVPLWAHAIGASPFWIGFAVAARSALPLVYAIHGGVLIDRLGTRRVMLVLALVSALLTPLHPLLPWVAAIAALQALIGLCNTVNWVGAQAAINQISRGHPTFTSRFSFFTVLGSLSGAPLAGLTWEMGGPWGAFGTIAAWTLGVLSCSYFLPVPKDEPGRMRAPVRLRDLVPNPASYAAAFRLLKSPAVAFVMSGTLLRNCMYGMRLAFYAVYLETIRFTSTEIGTLMAASSLAASPATLMMGPMIRIMRPHWVMLASLAAMGIGMTFTPTFPSFGGLLTLAVVHGFGMGLNLSLIIWMMSRVVKPEDHGLAFGLRSSVNPAGNLVVPLVMGAVAEAVGLADAFYVVGGALFAATAASWLLTRRPGARLGREGR